MSLPSEDAMEIAVHLHNDYNARSYKRMCKTAKEEDFPQFYQFLQNLRVNEFNAFLQNALDKVEETGPTEYTHQTRL